MPQIGSVDVPDPDVLAALQARTSSARPDLGDIFSAAGQRTIGQLRYGLPYQLAELTGTNTPRMEADFQRGLAEAEQAGSQATPAGVDDLTSGRVGIGRFITETLVSSLPYMAGAAVGAVGGGLVAGPPGVLVGGVAGGVPQFSASNVSRAVEEQGELSEDAAARALAVAPLQSAADMAVARFLPGAGKFLGKAASTQAGGFLRRTAASVAKAGGTEAATEAAQQVGERYAAGIPIGSSDAAAEYVDAAITAFMIGGVLGAGGGFRRSAANAKSAETVTNEDMAERVDTILDGSAKRLPPPADITVDPSGTARVNPSGTQQLALPSPEQFATPDVYVDSAGRASVAPPEGVDPVVLANLPRQSGPSDADLLARIAQATQPPTIDAPNVLAQPSAPAPARTDTSIAALSQVPVGQPAEVDVPTSRRLFKDEPIGDLDTAIRAKGGDPQIQEIAQQEIAARWAEAAGVEPLTTDDFKTRLDDVRHGLRGGWVQNLDAASPAELLDKVHMRIFEDADTAANVRKLAQRLGILDADLEPTPLAAEIEARRAAPEQAEVAQPDVPAAPVASPQVQIDPAFAPEWERIKREAGISRLRSGQDALAGTPPNLEAAQAQVFRALATDTSNAEVSQVEKLARKMGLVTDDDAMDVTPLGRQTFLATPEGLEETVAAAQQQGYAGAQASQFDRGVRAQVSGETTAPPFASFDDMAAYQAGKVWAKDFIENGDVRTAAQTEAIRARQDSRATGSVATPEQIERRRLTPEQVQQQSANQLLDLVDLRGVSDSDIAELRRMVRNGATPTEIGQALEQVQGGRTLFRQPETTARPEPAKVSRGQPVFREMYDPAENTPSKAEQRVQSEEAVQAYELRQLIDFARTEGGVTEARAQKLHDLLDAGKVVQVSRLLKDFDPDATTRKRLPTPPESVFDRTEDSVLGRGDAEFEAGISGKSFTEVLDYMIEVAPSKYYRAIMQRAKALAAKLEKAGATLDIQVLRPGDTGPVALNSRGRRAMTVSELNPARSTVYLKSSEVSAESGVNYQIAAHEIYHAVTDRLVDSGRRERMANTQLGRDVDELVDLFNGVISHFNKRVAGGAKLTDFERAWYERNTNALADPHELIAWGMTNPDMQRYLQSIEYKPRQSVFGRFVELLRKLLGIEGKYETALTELLRVSERITKAGQGDIVSAYARNNPSGFDTATLESPAQAGIPVNRTAAAANDAVKTISQTLGKAVDQINPQDLKVKSRRALLGWLSHNQIDRQWGSEIPAAIEHGEAHGQRVALRSRWEQMGEAAYQKFEALEKSNPNAAKWTGELMAATTEFQLDPDKTWDEHTWIDRGVSRDKNGQITVDPKKREVANKLKRLHKETVELANKLKRGNKAGWEVFTELRRLNEAQNYARLAVNLHGLVASDVELSLGIENAWVNPADKFMATAGLSDPTAIRDYWLKELDDQVAAATAFVREKKGAAANGTDSDIKAMRQHLSPIELLISAIHEAKAAMSRAPYFHLGRFGDNFGSAVIRKGSDGRVDPEAQRKVAEALEAAGFDNAQISADNTNPRIMLRFETADQVVEFRKLARKMLEAGLLDADSEIKAGPRNMENNYGTADGLPAFVSSYIQNLEASPMFAEDETMSPADKAALRKFRQETIQLARDTWIESQPDHAISKVLTKRYTIPGYNKDMIRNWSHRWRVGAISIANVASAPKFNRAFTNMKAQYNDALVENRQDAQGNPIAPSDPFVVQDVMNELKLRDAKNPLEETADTFDKLRAFAHSYFLGFSPAYGMINMTQLGVVALPELAKKHGYVKAFHAMRRATPQVLSVARALASEASKLGWKHAGDVTITEDVLKKAGLDESTRGFVLQMLATGTIDIGTMARSLAQVADDKGVGGKTDTYLRLSSAMGLYTETVSRLITALAARDLHGGYGPEAQKYAARTVSEAMFDYQNWNTARQLGKKGFLGPVTPIVTQFMSYQAQITEKLYAEAMDAFGRQRPGESAERASQRRAESRRFLMGHLTAVTTLAGTLGLPFATAFAAALEKLASSDDEPFDATASWRNFLADIFGPEVAEVMARGLPRAAGFDISQRVGEQNLLPFSDLLADKRSWKEAVANSSERSIGAAPSMLISILDGGAQFADGDVLGGMKSIVPLAFKGPVEAYRMSEQGYVDTRGTKLPITPGAASILWQLLGFSPAEKAGYSEERQDQAVRRGQIVRRAGQLRQRIADAVEQGDAETARELIGEAITFDQANPSYAVIPTLEESIRRRQTQRVQSIAQRTPLGVSARDIAGQQLTRYSNTAYGQ